jgi:hypothetical protein
MTGIGEALAGLFKALALALGLVRDNRLRDDGAREAEQEMRHEADEVEAEGRAISGRVDALDPAGRRKLHALFAPPSDGEAVRGRGREGSASGDDPAGP